MLRVRVEIVPWGREDMAQEIAVLNVCNNDGGSREIGMYDVYLAEEGGDGRGMDDDGNDTRGQHIGRFSLERYGWYRNRLSLAARALSLLQALRDAGECLPSHELIGDGQALMRPVADSGPPPSEPLASPEIAARTVADWRSS